MIVIDTSVIVAYMNAADQHHAAVSAWIDATEEDLVTTPLVIAEVDHVVGVRGGRAAQRALRVDLAAGAYLVDWWAEAINEMVPIAEQYADLGLGLVDASLVALAQRVASIDIATLDDRHFRAVRPLTGGDAFRLLPQDDR